MDRIFYKELWQTLDGFKPMVFMAGPRQAGKTTLARQIAADCSNPVYFNYDIPEDQRRLIASPNFYENLNRRDDSPPLVVLDEIHKYARWKNYLKGAYDRDAGRYRFLVLGSGRLDLRQKGGDSLAGRYLLFHLWPFTLAELAGVRRSLAEFLSDPMAVDTSDSKARRETWEHLARWSGFPEPFLKGSDEFHLLWSRAYAKQIVREDILSLVHVQKVGQVELLHALLPERVGSPLSLNQIAGAIGVSFDSVKSWVGVLDDFFLTFRLRPWTRKLARAILKEQKLYLMNPALVPGAGARFENQVALELHRAVARWNELGKGTFSLHYARTKEGEEADFLVVRGRDPILLVEAKAGEVEVSPALRKIQRMLGVPAIQLVNRPGQYKRLSEAQLPLVVASAEHWLPTLP
jgi:predicted AAA+ superfamily ATPase